MGEKRNQVNKVTVTIYNEDYIVKGTEKPDYIEMLASYVDRRMRMVQQRNVNLSTSKVAVLTALNLANELNKLQEDYDELVKTWKRSAKIGWDKMTNREIGRTLDRIADLLQIKDETHLRSRPTVRLPIQSITLMKTYMFITSMIV